MKLISVVIIILALQSNHVLAETKQTLTFGIVPQQSASKLLKNWGPILKFLSETSGIKIVFKTAKDIPTFESELAKGHYDISYMNPYHYIVFSKNPGYIAFAKAANRKIQGIIIVKKDGSIKTLQDLNAQSIAFPSPNAFAASMLTQAELKAESIQINPKYVSSHDSVYLNVAKGIYLAGGGIKRTFNATSNDLKDKLTILKETQKFTPHAFAHHPRVPKDIIMKLSEALTSLHHSQRGQKLLQDLYMSSIETASNRDWDDIRALNLQTKMP